MTAIEMFPGDDLLPHDEDVKFEKEKEASLPVSENPSAEPTEKPVGETIIPPKEETLGKSDFPPLSDEDKKSKIDESYDVAPGKEGSEK